MIKPEQVKKLAEFMGYKILDKKRGITQSVDDVRKLAHGGYIYLDSFNTLENADQDSALEREFKIHTQPLGTQWLASIWTETNPSYLIQEEGDSPSEARLKVTIEYVERLEG